MPPTLWLILLRTPNFFCSKEYQKSLQIGSFNCFSTDKTSPWALAEKNSGVISLVMILGKKTKVNYCLAIVRIAKLLSCFERVKSVILFVS